MRVSCVFCLFKTIYNFVLMMELGQPMLLIKMHVGCSDETSIKNSANSVTKIEDLHLLLLEN